MLNLSPKQLNIFISINKHYKYHSASVQIEESSDRQEQVEHHHHHQQHPETDPAGAPCRGRCCWVSLAEARQHLGWKRGAGAVGLYHGGGSGAGGGGGEVLCGGDIPGTFWLHPLDLRLLHLLPLSLSFVTCVRVCVCVENVNVTQPPPQHHIKLPIYTTLWYRNIQMFKYSMYDYIQSFLARLF